jgi:DNA-binding winged helix-turn-helix (wHTH) protein/Tfp pilus assembly protein PilF
MRGENSHICEFGSFRIDLIERQLLNGDSPVAVTPKAFDVLTILVERAGHLVDKETLMGLVWPDSFVEEANLARIIHTLRKILREDQNGIKYIETVPKKGYRFIAELTEIGESGSRSRFANNIRHVPDVVSSASERKAKPLITSGSLIAAAAILLLPALIVGLLLLRGYWYTKSPRLLTPETVSGEALQNYREGKLLVERRHPGDYQKSLQMFERAIELDPYYANPYAGIADAKMAAYWISGKNEDISAARTALRKALELDNSNSYGHTANCRILTTYDWDHAEAEKECRKAVELDPDDHEAQKELALLLHSSGRESEALEAIDRAVTISPTSFNKRTRGLILYQSRRYDDAIAQFEQVEQTDPLFKETARWLLWCHEMKEDYGRALETYLILKSQSGASPDEIATIRSAFAQSGWPAVLQTMIDSQSKPNLFQVGTLAELGEKDKAFEVLNEMIKRRAVMLVMIAREPTLDHLRNDPRFENILKRVGLNK